LVSNVNIAIEALPKVSGGGDFYFSNTAVQALHKAVSQMKEFGDQFVALEHILIALVEGNDQTAQILKDLGLNKKELLSAVKELRKGKQVASENAEDSYNALQRYAVNLNEKASSGKLDPVVGRDE
jgi:ATP-dependent Clp protease ATP-binding subunit ClpB